MSVFQRVGRARTVYSNHNMSHRVLMDAEFGLLYPVLVQEVVPGDVLRISNEMVIRFMPMLAPLLHQVDAFVHYFMVPYRILWDGWEKFITGGEDGNDSSSQPLYNMTTPGGTLDHRKLSTYLNLDTLPQNVSSGFVQIQSYLQNAYNMIWNEWYRDTNLQDEVPLSGNLLLYRSWRKDYFTSARIDTQLGDEPAIPIHGSLIASTLDALIPISGMDNASTTRYPVVLSDSVVTPTVASRAVIGSDPATANTLEFNRRSMLGTQLNEFIDEGNYLTPGNAIQRYMSLQKYLRNYVNVTGASVNVNQLREIVQIQRWKERNMRAGARYVDFIKARFPVSPRDDRLQRPEFIGGSRSPIIISEVLQTSELSNDVDGRRSPTGSMAGHGITVDRSYITKVKAYEYGLVMGLLSVLPKPVYAQGIERMWTRPTRYDYYFPEFQHLGEQPIFKYELFANTNDFDELNDIFGYQGRYNEMRHRRDYVVSKMKTDLSHWHLARFFSQPPNLNDEFIKCNDVDVGRSWAVPSEPPMIINFGNVLKMSRPMVGVPNPGLVDHI